MGHGDKQTRKGAREMEHICSNTTSLISVTWLQSQCLGSGQVSPVGSRDLAELPWSWGCRREGFGEKMGFMLSRMALASLGNRQQILPPEAFLSPKDSVLNDLVWLFFHLSYEQHLSRDSPSVSDFSFFTSGKATWTGVVIPCTGASLFWHGKTNHITVLTKDRPRSIRKATPFFTCYVVNNVFYSPRGTNLKYYCTQETHLLHSSWPTGCLVTSPRHLFWWLQKAQIGLEFKLFPGRVRVRMKKIWGFLEQWLFSPLPSSPDFAKLCWPSPGCLGTFFPDKMALIHLSCRINNCSHCSHSSLLVHKWRKEGQRQVIAGIWHTWAVPRPISSLFFSLFVRSKTRLCCSLNTALILWLWKEQQAEGFQEEHSRVHACLICEIICNDFGSWQWLSAVAKIKVHKDTVPKYTRLTGK